MLAGTGTMSAPDTSVDGWQRYKEKIQEYHENYTDSDILNFLYIENFHVTYV